jgi:carbon monoxide dehydrogenase subunit G
MRVEVSTVIDAPVEEVWGFMVDLGTMPQRDPSVVKVDWKPPLRAGSVAVITFRQMGNRIGKYEVKELEKNQRLRVGMTAMGAKIEGTYEMEPADDGKTKLSAAVQIEVHGLMRLLFPFISRNADKDAKAEFGRIKRAIEAQRGTVSGGI